MYMYAFLKAIIVLGSCTVLVMTGCKDDVVNRVTTYVPDKEIVNVQLDGRINYFIRLYGSKEKLEQASGKTIAQLRDEYRSVIVAQMVVDHIQN